MEPVKFLHLYNIIFLEKKKSNVLQSLVKGQLLLVSS